MGKKLNIGIIGAGGIAQSCHIPGYQSMPDQCQVVALCDTNPETLAAAGEKFGIARLESDHRALTDDPTIDAVSVTTPNLFHFQPVIDALRGGKHVLCEKPLAMNADEARQMVEVARETGKTLQVGLNWRFHAHAQFMEKFIAGGGMGDIYYARAKALRRRGVPPWGVFIDKAKQGGGPLIDIGVHILDLTLHLMGNPKPVSASGRTWDMMGKDPQVTNFWGPYDRSKFTVEDFAVGFIRLENGAAITLESSFMANMEGDPFETQLYGTRAGAIVRASGENPIRIFGERNEQFFEMIPPYIPPVASSHTAEIQAFIRCILDGTECLVPAERGWHLNAIIDALYRSSESGREELVEL